MQFIWPEPEDGGVALAEALGAFAHQPRCVSRVPRYLRCSREIAAEINDDLIVEAIVSELFIDSQKYMGDSFSHAFHMATMRYESLALVCL